MPQSTSESVSPQLAFVVRSGKFKGQRYPLFVGMTIGRGEQAHLYLPDFKASRLHAKVTPSGPGFDLEDLKSHNGTFVNGDRIDRVSINDGDVVHIGSTRLEVIAEKRRERTPSTFPGDTGGLTPTIVRRVDLLTPPTLDEVPAEEYLTALGIPAPADLPDGGSEIARRVLTKTRNFAIVYEISKALASAVQVEELLTTAIDFILRVISADRGYLILRDPETGELRAGISRHGDSPSDGPLEFSRSIIEWVIKEQSAVVSSDASTDKRFQDRQSIVLYNIRSVMAAPMMTADKVIGVIQLDSVGTGVGFSEDDLELISVIAPVLAVAIENTRLIEAQERTIAELRAAHAKLMSAQQKLVEKEKMAIVGRITSGLTHEIKNLMGPFMLADLLLADYPDDEHIQECSSLIIEAYTRIESLVEEIRLLARGEQAEMTLKEHDLTTTVEAVARFMRCDKEVQQHRIVVDIEGVPLITFDENRMKQVLINLVRNATHAMESAGEITVRARRDRSRPGFVRIEVIDQGVGIPAGVRDRIFEPFFSTKSEKGTGLGLDVCKTIVERHSGQISCESAVGEGTSMIVLLPLNPIEITA